MATLSTNGGVAIGSSYTEVLFDELSVFPLPAPELAAGSAVGHVSIQVSGRAGGSTPAGMARHCHAAHAGPALRTLRALKGGADCALKGGAEGWLPDCAQPFGIDDGGGFAGPGPPAPKGRVWAGYTYGAGLAFEMNRTALLQQLSRWRTAGATAKHTLDVLDVTGLTLPANLSAAKLVATAVVDMASCSPDPFGFCWAGAATTQWSGYPKRNTKTGSPVAAEAGARPQLEAGRRYFLISTESTGSAADVVYSAVAVAAPPRPTAARLAGLALSVNGSLSYVPAAACADVAAAGACQCSSNTLQTSCSSSDWLALTGSVGAGWVELPGRMLRRLDRKVRRWAEVARCHLMRPTESSILSCDALSVRSGPCALVPRRIGFGESSRKIARRVTTRVRQKFNRNPNAKWFACCITPARSTEATGRRVSWPGRRCRRSFPSRNTARPGSPPGCCEWTRSTRCPPRNTR